MSDFKARETIRVLARKGCIAILDRDRMGHRMRPVLPEEFPSLLPAGADTETVDIEGLDFYSGRVYVDALVKRENGRCFYCLKRLDATSCALDHVIPLAAHGSSGHRNVVASFHECNALKGGQEAADFLRDLYRRGLLSSATFSRTVLGC